MLFKRASFDGIFYDLFAVRKSQNVGLSFINGNTGSTAVDQENPPFVPRFYVLKYLFNETQTTPHVSFVISHLSIT